MSLIKETPEITEKASLKINEQNQQQDLQTDNKVDIEKSLIEKPKTIQKTKSSTFQALVNLLKTLVGSSIWALPLCFAQAGILLAALMIIFIGFMVWYTTLLYIKIGKKSNEEGLSLAELLTKVVNKNMGRLFSVTVSVYCFGVGVSYVVYTIQFFTAVFIAFGYPLNRIIYLLFAFIIITPISFIKNIHFLNKYSLIGNVLLIATVLVALQYTLRKAIIDPVKFSSNFYLANPLNLPKIFGVTLLAFECMPNIIFIRNSMKSPNKFPKIFTHLMIWVPLFFVLVGSTGAIAFGENTQQVILFNLSDQAFYFYIFELLFVFVIILSYPLQIFQLNDVLESVSFINKITKKPKANFIERNFVRFIVNIVIFSLGFFVKGFSTVLNITGSISGVMVQFVIPFMAYHIFYQGKYSIFRKISHGFIGVFTVIAGILSIYVSVKSLI